MSDYFNLASVEDYKPVPLRNFVLENIENGIKATELAALVTHGKHETVTVRFFDKTIHRVKKFTQEPVMELINKMIADGDIVELEYILPAMDYRIKSMYFPRGTKLNVIRHDKIVGA